MTTTPTYETMLAAGRDGAPEAVRVERHGDRAVVTLAEPERRNALSAPLVSQLKAALGELAADRELRAIVLTGTDPGFSAGGDLAFALTCDLALASERARIVPAFGRLGLIPEVGTSWALTRRLGYQGAFAFYAAGRQLDAAEAKALGLVHEVVAHDELLASADAWCDRIAALPAHALAMAKPLLRAAADASWDGVLAMEEFAEPACFTTRAFADAVRAMSAR